MKLLLENWRQYLNEEQEGKGMLLYSATCSPLESYINGITPERASEGWGQGKGFYFFTNKENAIKYGRELEIPESERTIAKEKPCRTDPPKSIIIVSDEPVTPENFDIDYEVFASGFVEFIFNNPEDFPVGEKIYGIKVNPAREGVDRLTGEEYYYAPTVSFRSPAGSTTISLETTHAAGTGGITVGKARKISATARILASENPNLFKRFEEEALSQATAIKYNGTEIIMPLRIEDLEGKILWSR